MTTEVGWDAMGTADWWDETTAAINAWHVDQFPDADMRDMTVVLAEETGEVAKAVAKLTTNIRRGTDWETKLQEESADVVFVLISLARVAGFDLSDAIRDRVPTVTARDYRSETEDAR